MIKVTFCLHRLPTLSRAQFQHYWRTVHAPLVAQYADVLRLRRYVQTHTRDDPRIAALPLTRRGPGDYDGIAQLWWEDRDFMAHHDDPARRAALRVLYEDETRFIDHSRSPLFVGEENVVLPGAVGP